MSKQSSQPQRTPLTRERALIAAMGIADAESIAALTMRRLAQELGVEAMSLYHHVANKDDILDGMVDLVFAEIDIPELDDDWRITMRARSHSTRAALRRHPWALALLESRSAPGPATLFHHNQVLGRLRTAGFSLVATGHAYALLDSYVYGFVHQEQTLPFETPDETKALAASIIDPLAAAEYPYLIEMATDMVLQPGYAFANEFEFGLELILDGLERLRSQPSSTSRRSTPRKGPR